MLDLLDAVDRMRARGRPRAARRQRHRPRPRRGARPGPRPTARELTGYTDPDGAPDVYRSADVFVSPTYSEGFSNTVLEAMASGLPVVSTDSVGVVDCLEHDRNGLLHEPGDVEGLVAQLCRLLDDPPLRTRLAATALEEVRRLYSWPVLARSGRATSTSEVRGHGVAGGPRPAAARPVVPLPQRAPPAVRVLAVSPHLDDAAFSVGGVLARARRRRARRHGRDRASPRRCRTRTGFALACQTDKGIAPDVDYLALRRDEDVAGDGGARRRARCTSGCRRRRTAATTARPRCSPACARRRRCDLLPAARGLDADVLLAPQGLGGHVDHLQVVRGRRRAGPPDGVVARTRPTCCARRTPPPSPDLPARARSRCACRPTAQRRADACACYATQLGYQFGRDSALAAGGGDARRASPGSTRCCSRTPRAREVLDGGRSAQPG